MSKRRYTLYLSRSLARKLDDTAREQNGAKPALVEEALRVSLSPQLVPGIDDVLARRLDELGTLIKTIERDVSIATETLSLFVRYFLTITPPLPTDDQESARLLGKERFQVFVAQVGRQLAGSQRLVTEVLEIIVAQRPDLLASAGIDAPLKPTPTPTPKPTTQPNGHEPEEQDSYD